LQTAIFLKFFRPVWSIETMPPMTKSGENVSMIGRGQSHDVLADHANGRDSNFGQALSAMCRLPYCLPYQSQHTQGELLMTRLIALLLIAGTAALAGCNTTAGAGQDISKAGSALTNSADKHGAE
jgi:entericidin B